MMYVGIILICGLVCLYFSRRNIVHPGFLMSAMWVIILALYEAKLLPFNDISNLTYATIVIGVIGFCIGSGIGNNVELSMGEFSSRKSDNCNYSINVNFIIALEIISLVVMFPDVINNIRLLLSGFTFETIRTNSSSGGSVLNNIYFALIRNYIVKPFLVIVYPITVYCLFSLKNRTRYIILGLAICMCTFHVFYLGGRSPLIYLAMHFVLAMILLKKDFNISNKAKVAIVILIVLVVYIFEQVSVSRGVSDMSSSVIAYISGCVPLLDVKISEIDAGGIYSYGSGLLLGVLRLVFTLLENIGFPYPAFMSVVENLANCENSVVIGQNMRMNAFVSVFYYFYIDGGLLAVLIESIVYGWFSGSSFRKMNSSKDPRQLIIYMVVCQSIVFSMVRYQFVLLEFVIALILVRFLFREEDSDEYIDCYSVS